MINGVFAPNEVVIEKNTEWLERVHHSPIQASFVTKMINIEDTVPITPDSAYNEVDDSPFTWAILVYNSNNNEFFDETEELACALSKHFRGRVAVGMLDLGYPSNFATFGDLFGHEVPAVLVKYPQKIHQMFHHDDVTPEMIHLEHDDIDLWGTTFSHKELVAEPEKVLESIDAIYDEMHESYKVGSIFMEHYNFTDPRKDLTKYYQFFNKIFNKIQEESLKTAKQRNLLHEAMGDGLSQTEKQLAGERLYNFLVSEMDRKIKEKNLKKELLTAAKFHQERTSQELSEIEIPEIPVVNQSAISKWKKLRNEL